MISRSERLSMEMAWLFGTDEAGWPVREGTVRIRSMGPAWNGSPWVDLANGATVPFRLHDDYRLGRVSDGGWPTRDADGR